TSHSAGSQTEFVEPPNDPNRAVDFTIEPLRQQSAPGIIDNNDSANVCCLDHRFSLTTVSHSACYLFNQEDVNGRFIVGVAALNKAVRLENSSQAVLSRTPPEQLRSHRFGQQHSRKQETQLWQEIEMIKGDDVGRVNRTNGRPHYRAALILRSENQQA